MLYRQWRQDGRTKFVEAINEPIAFAEVLQSTGGAMKWHLANVWKAVADTLPQAAAVANGGVRRPWREYDDRAARIACGLAAAGIGPNSKVGVYAYNCNENLEAHLAIFKVRACPINVNYRYTGDELVYLLDDADAEALVFDAGFGRTIAAIAARLPKLRLLIEIEDGSGAHLDEALRFEDLVTGRQPDLREDYSEDDLYMLYTGGTTGMPKGVMYRQGDFTQLLMAAFDGVGVARPTSRQTLVDALRHVHDRGLAPVSLVAAPLMHGVGLWAGAFMAHSLGGCAVTVRNVNFDPHELWRTVESERVTRIALVGDAFAKPMLAALKAAATNGRPYDLSSLKTISSSGVMFSQEVKNGLLEFADLRIVDMIASSEGGMGLSEVSRAAPWVETAKFAAMPTTKVFDENDREIAPGSDKIGLVANGGCVPIGYYKDPKKSASTFRIVDGHRYAFPGDYAKVGADGSIVLLGRGSNCINTGGEKVFPEEVEEALKAHPDVFDCLVVGVPDNRFGERVTAVLSHQPERQPDAAALISFARGRIAGYKVPRVVILVDQVRRAPNGKPDYAWARRIAIERST